VFHLFNKVYLKHESLYNSSNAGLIACADKSQHPISRIMGIETAVMPTFDEILQQQYNNDIENLWESLLKQSPNTRFDFLVDAKILSQITIQYWKSIFKNPDLESIYKLHKFFVLDSRLKSFIFNDFSSHSRSDFYNSIKFLSKNDFTELYEKTQVSTVLNSVKKDAFGFEYLLADYFNNPKTRYQKAFKEKVRSLAWKKWANDAEVLKADILNDFYNIKKLVPTIDIQFEAITEVEKHLTNDPNLNWMLDENFNEHNPDYIRRNYSKDIFVNLYRNLFVTWPGGTESLNSLPSAEVFSDDQMALTNLVFDEDFDEFLRKDIARGFGCLLTSDHLRQKSNQIFVSYLYEKIRNKQTDELKHYELA
jgi:hypothetical protein